MAITLGSQFSLQTALPLDDRLVVADSTTRDAIAALVRYEGMIVYVTADETNYQLVGGITNGDWQELSGSGGGGGGSSLSWYDGDLPPLVRATSSGMRVFDFAQTDTQKRFALWRVPDNYSAGDPITLTGGRFSAVLTSGNVLFKVKSRIFDSAISSASTPNAHTSANIQQAVSGTTNLLVTLAGLDITEADGEIDGVPVAAGNVLLLEFYRDVANETSAVAGDVSLIMESLAPVIG